LQLSFSIFQRKNIWVPTWKGWVLFIFLLLILLTLLKVTVYSYLATNEPYKNGVLVIEGSLPDYAFDSAMIVFNNLKCEKILITGGPVPMGTYSGFQTYVDVGVVKLNQLGFDPEKIVALPSKKILRDRTYSNALIVNKWLKTASIQNHTINILTIGPHARRSKLLYTKAIGAEYQFGIISLDDLSYDQNKWWKSSIGFRTVVGEALAYLYVKCFFIPRMYVIEN